MDALTELAKMLKGNENPPLLSMTTGIVISPLPEIKIQLTEVISLDKSKLIVAEHIYTHYQQELVSAWLQPGDEVILMPTTDNQLYFLLDKVRRLE